MRESMPVIDPESKSSTAICGLGDVLRAAAVLAIASATIWRWANAVRMSWSLSRSPRPFCRSAFLASLHSRRLIAGNPRLRARASTKWPDDGCWTKNLHNQTDGSVGAIDFIDGSNAPVKFNISFRGLPQAADALAKE
jgi:hypothetical protein